MQASTPKLNPEPAVLSMVRDIEPAVRLFGHLRHHRTRIAEGLRRTARRNMLHFSRVKERILPPDATSWDSEEASQWIERIQAQTLSDQGLENTATNRSVLPYATFWPVRAYCAVLYAEIDFLRRRDGCLRDRDLLSALDTFSDLVAKMRRFRDGLLHPRDHDLQDEAAFVNHELFDQVPGLQFQIDLAIDRIRSRLRTRVEKVLLQLPEEQALACRHEGIRRILEGDALLDQDSIYSAAVREEHRRVIDRLSGLPEAVALLKPSSRHAAMVDRIAGMYSATFQFNPCGAVPDLVRMQPPMNETLHETLVLSAFPRQERSQPEFQGGTAKYVSKHWYGYLSMMQTAATLLNENLHWLRLMDSPPNLAFQKTPPWERIRLSALGMVTNAIMVPVLAAYRDVQGENPEESIPILDEVVGDKAQFSALHELRKEVFHVIEPKVTSNVAELRDTVESDSCHRLAKGLPIFLSWLAPPQQPQGNER